jgi:hypothetical protein
MKSTITRSLIFAIVLFVSPVTGQAGDRPTVPAEIVADYVYAVIESHRAFYTTHVVERLDEQEGTKADGDWRQKKKTLPLPVQLVTESSEMLSTKFTGIRYRLISLWPINPRNSAKDQEDKHSLEVLGERPERPVTRTIKIEDQDYFHAIYADLAVSPACVACHNTHPNSPKKNFQVGDVMGGLVIEFPLRK